MMATTRFWRLGTICLIVMACISFHAAAADASTASTTPIPYKRDASSAENDLGRLIVGLSVCGVALAGVLYLLRRRVNRSGKEPNQACRLRILDTQRLNQRSTLYVIEFADAHYMVAENGQEIRCLASAPARRAPNQEQT